MEEDKDHFSATQANQTAMFEVIRACISLAIFLQEIARIAQAPGDGTIEASSDSSKTNPKSKPSVQQTNRTQKVRTKVIKENGGKFSMEFPTQSL